MARGCSDDILAIPLPGGGLDGPRSPRYPSPMAERDCPKCPYSPMEPATLANGVEADRCPKCKGLWFDPGELSRAAKNPVQVEMELAAPPLRPKQGTAQCPDCHTPMLNVGVGSEFLRVDRCMSGHGLWLDAGEERLLEELLAR